MMALPRRDFMAGSVSALAGLAAGCSSSKEGKSADGQVDNDDSTGDGTRGPLDVEAVQQSLSNMMAGTPWDDLYADFAAQMEAIRAAYADAGKVAAADLVHAIGTDLLDPLATAASAFLASPPESDEDVFAAFESLAADSADRAAALEAPLTAYLEELAADGLPEQAVPQFDRAAGLSFFRARETEMRALIDDTDNPHHPAFQGLLKSVQEMQVRFGSESRAADPRVELEAALAQLRSARTARSAGGPPPPPSIESCSDMETWMGLVVASFGFGGLVGGGAGALLAYSSGWGIIGLTLLMLESFMFLLAFAIAAFALILLLVVIVNFFRVWVRYVEECLE